VIRLDKKVDFTQNLTDYGFKLPVLASLGIFLLDKIPCDFNDRETKAKLIQLFGHNKALQFFKIHLVQKLTLITVTVVLLALISLFGEVDYSFYIFGSILLALIPFWTDRELDKKINRRKRAILVDLPGCINTLAVLINAGLPLTAALQKITLDGSANRPLYKELRQLMVEIHAGRPVNQAYEDFAHRCKVPEITRFVSAMLQNLNRGNADLVYVLRILSQEAWVQRKDIARKQGEEASSKLVLPMVMVFLAVAIIVLAPAVMSMSN
jgi:tight adherence protein C